MKWFFPFILGALLTAICFYAYDKFANSQELGVKDVLKARSMSDLSAEARELVLEEYKSSIEMNFLPPVKERGRFISWSGEGMAMAKSFSKRVPVSVSDSDYVILKWPRNTVGWLVDAEMVNMLINETTDKPKDLLIELGERIDSTGVLSNTIIISGLTDKEIHNDVENGYYRVRGWKGGVTSSERPLPLPNDPAIEYVGPCNTCP